MADIDLALAEANRTGARPGPVKQLHVVPRGDGWAVKRVGLRISELFDNKPDAIEHAQRLAKASGTEWVEYRRDGTVRDIHRPADRNLPARQAQR